MGRIIGALLYLRVTSMRNALVSRVMRLKQPKYLVGAMVGIGYFYLVLFRRAQMSRSASASGLASAWSVDQLPMATTLFAALVLIFFALCWVWSRERAALAFSESEIAFFFPAPVSRKALIHYRLIDSQSRLLLTSLILALISSGWSFLLGGALIRIVGWWILFSTISLHIIGSAFTITKWMDGGMSSLRRQTIAFCVVAFVAASTGFWVWRYWHPPTSDELTNFSATLSYIASALDSSPLGYLLLPLKWVLGPLLAPDLHAFLLALGPAFVVFAAHYVWVLYSEASFEEGSIARAQKRAARVAAMRAGNVRLNQSAPKARRTPFNVSAVRRVELAFLWKNLISSAEYLRPRSALIAAIVIVVASQWLTHSDHEVLRSVIGSFSLGIGAYMLIFGPLIARQDLRTDIVNADILKTYPLRGWQVVLGEMLTPIVVVTVLLWLVLLTAALTFEPRAKLKIALNLRLWLELAAAVLIPLLCAIQLLVLNAAAIVFPAWMQTGQSRNAGIDVMGQRMLFFAALLVAMVLALIPAAVASAAIYFSTQWVMGVVVASIFAAVVLISVLCAEIAVGVRWLGNRFEHFDLSAELRP